ncbi:cache domain-containing protein [Desulfospira joergensenii]|uniref:cache domain-containing protein n=1 Tax=Desulfospira joergensenii TaxID=53329 RepID=UPI0003B2F6A9|nr:cache domain-containing protein [Desulfospira joergensenii]
MQKLSRMMVAMLVIFLMVCPGLAAEKKATREDCVAVTKEAQKMILEKGLEATLEKINDKEGPFVRKGTYVFCFMEDTVKMVGNPYLPERMRNFSQKDYMDANGKHVFQEFIKVVNEKGEGWVDYMHVRKPGEKPRKKISFVSKVPDTMVIVGAGIYE